MEGVGTIAGTVKIHSPKFAPPTVGSGVVRLTWSGSQTLAAVRKLRVEGSHTRFLRSKTQRPFANFALSFRLRKVRLRQCAGPIVYRPLPFCPHVSPKKKILRPRDVGPPRLPPLGLASQNLRSFGGKKTGG